MLSALLSVAATPGHAEPMPHRVSYAVADCHEVAAVAPGGLVVVVYGCASSELDGRALGPVVVHEVSEARPDGTFRLLRSVASVPALAAAMRSLGLPADASNDMTYAPPEGPAGGVHARLAVPGGRLEVSAVGATAEGTTADVLDGGGVSYWYDGPRGRVVLSYSNTFSGPGHGPGGGVAHVDASRDPRLATWMGVADAAGPAVVNRGSWTATAVLTRG